MTRTTIRSDRTRVPPVTALRSPPASRMTGADSPVIADSSTDATPSTTSPSPGIRLAGVDDDDVARDAAAVPGTSSIEPSLDGACGRASRSRVPRSDAACALPRASAIASAKFAKSTVNQSQAAMSPAKTFSCVASPRRLDEQDGHDDASDLDEEHHGVARDVARVELPDGRRGRPADDRGVEQGHGRLSSQLERLHDRPERERG